MRFENSAMKMFLIDAVKLEKPDNRLVRPALDRRRGDVQFPGDSVLACEPVLRAPARTLSVSRAFTDHRFSPVDSCTQIRDSRSLARRKHLEGDHVIQPVVAGNHPDSRGDIVTV